MSKYSSNPSVRTASRSAQVPDTVNLAGGQAHAQQPKLELASLVLTSFMKDGFYRTEKATTARLNELFARVDPVFIAKLAVFARHEYGMRSVSHYAAAWIGHNVHGATWLRSFYKSVIRRPDDILEILSCYISTNPVASVVGKRLRLPNAMKRGLGDKLSTLTAGALAKYRKDGAELTMIDAINLCHPKHTDAIEALMKGNLANADTWETAISAAGQNLEEGQDVGDVKGAEWDRLLSEGKLGYFALLRNIRNILEHATNPVPELCRQLVNRDAIKKSLVLPFRYLTAIEAVVAGAKNHHITGIMPAITDAVEIALENVPVFPGQTLVALDCSGSMEAYAKKASLFAAALVKASKADLILFSDRAAYYPVNVRNPVLTIAQNLPFASGGTNFHDIFTVAAKNGVKYDRVVIISDMQAWIGHYTPRDEFQAYCRKTGANPKVHSLDMAGLGTMQFPEPNVFCVAGFSEKIFETMALNEQDPHALINRINDQEI